MRLITQRGTRSFNFDNIEVFVLHDSICCISNEKEYLLGKYESDERAMEVFEEIHRTYAGVPDMVVVKESPNIKELRANIQPVTILEKDITSTCECVCYRLPAT